jgi:hypothetical protein
MTISYNVDFEYVVCSPDIIKTSLRIFHLLLARPTVINLITAFAMMIFTCILRPSIDKKTAVCHQHWFRLELVQHVTLPLSCCIVKGFHQSLEEGFHLNTVWGSSTRVRTITTESDTVFFRAYDFKSVRILSSRQHFKGRIIVRPLAFHSSMTGYGRTELI